MTRTHYDSLQVARNASGRVIRAAYKTLTQEWHPDKHPANKQEAERITKVVNEAYRVLSDPRLRKEYDEWVGKREKSQRAAPNQYAETSSDSTSEYKRPKNSDSPKSPDAGKRQDTREPADDPSNLPHRDAHPPRPQPRPLRNYWWVLIVCALVCWKAIQTNLLFALGFLFPSFLVGIAIAFVVWLTSTKRRKVWKLHNWLNTASYVMLALPFLQATVGALVHSKLEGRQYSYRESGSPTPIEPAPQNYSRPGGREMERHGSTDPKSQETNKGRRRLGVDNGFWEEMAHDSSSQIKSLVDVKSIPVDVSLRLRVPDIAENGDTVPFFVDLDKPIHEGERLLVVVDSRFLALSAFVLGDVRLSMVSARVKMPGGQPTISAFVKYADGRIEKLESSIRVLKGYQEISQPEPGEQEISAKYRAKLNGGELAVKVLMAYPSWRERYIRRVRTKTSNGTVEVAFTPVVSSDPFLGFEVNGPSITGASLEVSDNEGNRASFPIPIEN